MPERLQSRAARDYMSVELFVPADFAVPDGLTGDDFCLVSLGLRHNDVDFAAWTGGSMSWETVRGTAT
jgi:hypothetical protein